MTTCYIGSTQAFAGKTLVCVTLGRLFAERGVAVGYFKPLGTMPVQRDGVTTDEDVAFVYDTLGLTDPLADLCPLVLSADLVHRALRGETEDLLERVTAAFARVREGKDLLLIGGTGSLFSSGYLFGLEAPRVIEALDTRALVVARYEDERSLEPLLAAQALLGDRLLGALFNQVPSHLLDTVRERVAPAAERLGITLFGALPRDAVLRSVTVGELEEEFGAEVVCRPDRRDTLVENFAVGAMSVDTALKHFRALARKAVITGGDRADIQLAALETDTAVLLLTGGLPPNSIILDRAEQAGVPVLVVSDDTLSTVERIERLLGRLRIRTEAKVARALELAREHLDLERLAAALLL